MNRLLVMALMTLTSTVVGAQCPVKVEKLDVYQMQATASNTSGKTIMSVKFKMQQFDMVLDAAEPSFVVTRSIPSDGKTTVLDLYPKHSLDTSAYEYGTLQVVKVKFKDGSLWENDGSCKPVADDDLRKYFPKDADRLEGK